MNHLVSIIIPCYNGEDTIERAIQSVYVQDYNSIELIIVDDGSTDKSREKIVGWENKFADKGMSLNYIYQENAGVGGGN